MYRGKPNNWNYQGNGDYRQDEFNVSKHYEENNHHTPYRYLYENSRPYSPSRNHHQRKFIRRKYNNDDICEPNVDNDEEYNRPPTDRFNYHNRSSPRSRRHDSYQNNRRIYPTETIPKQPEAAKTENDANPTVRDESKCSNKVNTNNIEIKRNESKCCNNNIEDKSTVEGNKDSDQVVPKTKSLVEILNKNDFLVLEDDDDRKGSEGKNTFDDKPTELPIQESTITHILTNENDTKDKMYTEEKVITNSLDTTPIKKTQQKEEEVNIELVLQRLCNDPITINDINQSESYLDHFPLMDNYRIFDRNFGSPVTANKEQSKVTLSRDDLLEELDDDPKSNESNKTPTASSTPSTPLKRKHLGNRRMSVGSKISKKINDDEGKIKGNKRSSICEQASKVAKRRKSCVEDISHGRSSTNDVCRRSSLFSETATPIDTPTKDWKSIYFPSLRSDYTIPKATKSKPVFSQPDTPCCKPIHLLFNNDKVDESSSKRVATTVGNKVVEKEKSSKIVKLKEKSAEADSKQTITKRHNEKVDEGNKVVELSKNHVKVDKGSKVAEMSRSPKVGARKKDNGGPETRKKRQKQTTTKLATVKSSENVCDISKIKPKTTDGIQKKPKTKLSESRKSRLSKDEKDVRKKVEEKSKSVNSKKVSESDSYKTHESKVQSGSKQSPKKKLKATKTKKVSPKHVSTDNNLCNSATEHITYFEHSKKVGVEINAPNGVHEKNKKCCKKLNVFDIKNFVIDNSPHNRNNKVAEDVIEDVTEKNKKCKKLCVSKLKIKLIRKNFNKKIYQIFDDSVESKDIVDKDSGDGLDNSMKDVGSNEGIEQDSNVKKDNIIEGVKEFQKLDDGMEDTSKNEITGSQENEELNLLNSSLIEEFGGNESSEHCAKKDNIIEGVKEFQKLDDGIVDTSKNEDGGSHENGELNLLDNSLIEEFGGNESSENCAKKDNIIEGVKEFQKLDDGVGGTSKNEDGGSHENGELNLLDNSLIEELEGNEGSENSTHEFFDLKNISCEKIEPNKTDQKLKILSDIEDTSIQLVEFNSTATSPSIVIDLTSPEDDREKESDLKKFESKYARTQLSNKVENVENIQTVEEKASGVERNKFGNVNKLEEIFSFFNPNLKSQNGSDDINKNAIAIVKEEFVECIKTERNNDETFKEQLIVIKTPVKSEINEIIETCKNFMIHQYPTFQKVIPIPIEINDSEKASITEPPVVGTVEIIKQSQKIVQDIEIIQNVEIIDLTNETYVKVESNLCHDESAEKITLYRSDETTTDSPDVLATSASLSPSVLLNKNALNKVKNDGKNEVDDSKTEQDIKKSDENFTLLYSIQNNAVSTNQTVTATIPVQITSYAATSITTPPSYSQITRNTEIPATSSIGVYQIPLDPTVLVNVQQPSYAQDLRTIEEQRVPAPAAGARSSQFYENAPPNMMPYKERDREAVKEASTRRLKSNIEQRNTEHAATIPKTSQPPSPLPPPPPSYISLSEWQKCIAEYIWMIIHKSNVDVKDLSWIKSKNLTSSIYNEELKIVERNNGIRFTVYAKDMANRLHFTNILDHPIKRVHILNIFEYLQQIRLPITLLHTYVVLWNLIGPYPDYYSSNPILGTLYKVVYEAIREMITKSYLNKSSKSIPAHLFTSNQRDQLVRQIHLYNGLIERLRFEISASTVSRQVYYASNDTYNKENPKKPVLHQSKPQNIHKKSSVSAVKNNQPQQTTSVPVGRSYPSNMYDHIIYQRINGAVADNQAAYKSCGKQNQNPDQTNFTSNAASYQRQFSNKPYMRPNSSVQRPEYARVPGENSTASLPTDNSSMVVNYPQGLDNATTFKVPSKSNQNLRRKTTENNLPESTSLYVGTTDKTSSSSPYGPSILIPKISPNAVEYGNYTGSFLANESAQIIPSNQSISTDKTVLKNTPSAEIVNETITRNVEVDASNVVPEEEVIDLTWLDDFKTEELEEAVECIIKKEEPTYEEDEVILNQEQFPVAYSPSDSGVEGSPSPQREVNDIVFGGRYCICDKPAEYLCGCRMAMYCSNYCHNKDWIEHKKICHRAMHR